MRSFVVLISIFFCFQIYAKQSLDSRIEAIQKAPQNERYRLMNALKKDLAKMHKEKRIEAIRKLRKKLTSKATNHIALKPHSEAKMLKNKSMQRGDAKSYHDFSNRTEIIKIECKDDRDREGMQDRDSDTEMHRDNERDYDHNKERDRDRDRDYNDDRNIDRENERNHDEKEYYKDD